MKRPAGFVGLDQVHHGRAAVAAVAVHVLEQVQGRATAAVEQLHELGFGVQRVAAGQALQQRVQLGQPAGRQGAFLVQRRAEFAKVRTQFCVRVAQQVREHPQGQWEGLHTVALMGMVRFFSLPKRLVSVTPSLQPLPKLKPQPPRTLKAFSAYSRCVVGMTKRSS